MSYNGCLVYSSVLLFLFLFFFFGYNNPGPLSSVWKEWLKWCIEFGIEANAIIAVPYDWRLSASKLEERDLYFHKLKFVYFSYILLFIFQIISLLLAAVVFLLSLFTFSTNSG